MTRRLIALAGPPGSGKSTLAPLLAARLSGRVVPMDGFHLDNLLLDGAGLRSRKGAPETFDTAGLFHTLQRLKDGEDEVILPAFDRDRDAAIAGAIRIGPQDAVLVVEGNYLLADLPGWDRLAGLWDRTALLQVPEGELRRRLMDRWAGLGLSPQAADDRLANDLANAATVAARSRNGDVVLTVDPNAGQSPEFLAGQLAAALA